MNYITFASSPLKILLVSQQSANEMCYKLHCTLSEYIIKYNLTPTFGSVSGRGSKFT